MTNVSQLLRKTLQLADFHCYYTNDDQSFLLQNLFKELQENHGNADFGN